MHAGGSTADEEEEEEEEEEDGKEEEEEGEEHGREEENSGSDGNADADNLPAKGTPPPGRSGPPSGGSGRVHLRDPPEPLPPKRARVLSPLAPGMVRLRPLIPASSGEGSVYEPGSGIDDGSGSSADGSGGSNDDDPDGRLSEEEERLAVAGVVPKEQRWFRRQRERESEQRAHRRCRHSAGISRSGGGGSFNHGDALDAALAALTDDGDRARFKQQLLERQDKWLLEAGGLLVEQARGAMLPSVASVMGAGSGATATRSIPPQVSSVLSASLSPASAVLRDHRPFMHNGCNFLRMNLVPLGGSFLDLEGVVRHPASGTGFGGCLRRGI